MIFKKTIEHIDQLCAQADTMILEGKNSDQIITLHLRELVEQTLRESFEKIKHKMKMDNFQEHGLEGVITGIAGLIFKNEFLLEKTKTTKNRMDKAQKNIQNFEQKWLSSISYLHEADIDKLLGVLLINQKSGFESSLACLLGEINTITSSSFKN